MKYCSKCKKNKDISEFRISNRTKDGYFVWCRNCDKAYQKEWNIKNHDKQKIYSREYARERRKIPEIRLKELEKHRNWYNRNKEKISIKFKDKYKNNLDYRKKLLETSKEWRQNNKEKCKEDFRKWELEHFEERKLYKKHYEETHREWRREQAKILKAKRKRGLDFIKICNNQFDDSEKIDWHHMDDSYVIPIPTDLHTLFQGKMHRDLLIPIIRQIYGDDIDIWKKK